MGHPKICIICEINIIKERLVPKPTSFNLKRIKFLEAKINMTRFIKGFKLCSKEHRDIVLESRKKYKSALNSRTFKRRELYNNAKSLFADSQLLYAELVNEYGRQDIRAIRAFAEMSHYKILLAQRKRRLNEQIATRNSLKFN